MKEWVKIVGNKMPLRKRWLWWLGFDSSDELYFRLVELRPRSKRIVLEVKSKDELERRSEKADGNAAVA